MPLFGIENQLKKGICQINLTIEEGDIDAYEELMSSGMLDSFGFIEFVSFIETKFNISIDEDDLTTVNFKNIAQTANYIKSKLE